MTKDELRAELERQAQSFVATTGGEIVLYAAQRKPDRQPWRKKPSLLDEAFQAEIRKIELNRPGFPRHFLGSVNVASQTLPVTVGC